MSVQTILEQMLTLLQQQVEAVVKGDHQAVKAGADAYELLSHELEHAEYDVPPEALRPLYDEIQQEKAKLQSLLSVEVNRVEFLLRLLVGSGTLKPVGYPGQAKGAPGARMLNRRA